MNENALPNGRRLATLPSMTTSTFHVRTYRRLPVRCTVYFSTEDLQGTGIGRNLSLDGCQVYGNVSVRRGMVFSLFMVLPGNWQPIVVGQATVTWTHGYEFGLRFERIQPPDRKRLETFITASMSCTADGCEATPHGSEEP